MHVATRGQDADPARDDAAVVDQLLRKLRADAPAPARPAAPAAGHVSHRPVPHTRPVARPSASTGSRATADVSPVAAWIRVGVAVVAGVALTQWPYPRTCGAGLLAFLLAVAVVCVAGIWGASASWSARVAPAHVVALGTTLWGLVLAAPEVLPRVGHANVVPTAWRCPSLDARHGEAHHSPSIRLSTASPRATASSARRDLECTRTEGARQTT